MTKSETIRVIIGVIIITITIILNIIGLRCLVKHFICKPPVEEIHTVDSLITINDSIKIQVESLDSIKNAKVLEVVSLDNDSSIKLFYKLVSE